jgi:hypothetical protein
LALDAAMRGALAGALASTALAAVSRIVPLPFALPVAAAIPIVVTVAAVALAIRGGRLPRDVDAAIFLDRAHGTGEALVAALEARDDDDPRVLRAERRLLSAPADPMPKPPPALVPAIASLALAASLFALVPAPSSASPRPRAPDGARAEAVDRAARDIADSSRATLSGQGLAEELARLAAAIRSGDAVARETSAAEARAALSRDAERAAAEAALRSAIAASPAIREALARAVGGAGTGSGTGDGGGEEPIDPTERELLREAIREARAASAPGDRDPELDRALARLEEVLRRSPATVAAVADVARQALAAAASDRLGDGAREAAARALANEARSAAGASAVAGSGPDLLSGEAAAAEWDTLSQERRERALGSLDLVDSRYEWIVRRYFSDEPTPR